MNCPKCNMELIDIPGIGLTHPSNPKCEVHDGIQMGIIDEFLRKKFLDLMKAENGAVEMRTIPTENGAVEIPLSVAPEVQEAMSKSIDFSPPPEQQDKLGKNMDTLKRRLANGELKTFEFDEIIKRITEEI